MAKLNSYKFKNNILYDLLDNSPIKIVIYAGAKELRIIKLNKFNYFVDIFCNSIHHGNHLFQCSIHPFLYHRF